MTSVLTENGGAGNRLYSPALEELLEGGKRLFFHKDKGIKMKQTDFNIEEAIQDPGAFFATPEEVLRADFLSADEKKKILDSWKVDQTNLLVAEEENMASGAPQGKAAEKLRQISKAKESLH